MGITTRSMFLYDYEVTSTTREFALNEGSGEIVAELTPKAYSATDLNIELERALNEAGILDYFCSFDRDTRLFTISASANFDILVSSATSSETVFDLIGFTGADKTGTDTYEGDTQTGTTFRPQFYLQNYIDFEDNEGIIFASTSKTASGKVEVVGFGDESFSEFQIKYQTDIIQGDSTPIETNANGVSSLREFMRYGITKGPIEFMPDRDDTSTFTTCILEKTASNRSGVSYKLKEMYSKGLFGYYETGKVTLRKLV